MVNVFCQPINRLDDAPCIYKTMLHASIHSNTYAPYTDDAHNLSPIQMIRFRLGKVLFVFDDQLRRVDFLLRLDAQQRYVGMKLSNRKAEPFCGSMNFIIIAAQWCGLHINFPQIRCHYLAQMYIISYAGFSDSNWNLRRKSRSKRAITYTQAFDYFLYYRANVANMLMTTTDELLSV